MNKPPKRDRKKRKEYIETKIKKVKKNRCCLKCDRKFDTYYYFLCDNCRESNCRILEYL